MKKALYIIMALAVVFGLSSCGDNKTKKKLYGTQMITGGSGDLSTSSGMSQAISLSASVGASACGKSTYAGMAPAKNAAGKQASGADLGAQGADGYYTLSGYAFSNTTVKIRFQDAAGNALSITAAIGSSSHMANLAKFRILVTTRYEFGTFNGDFLIVPDLTASNLETMESGTITTADPVGGTFTAVISNMVVERTTVNGIPFGRPISGTMTIAGKAGGYDYTGTNTYSKSGSDYKCEGPINVKGAKVADVYLTFNNTTGNYTGYWIDAATAERHAIE